MRKRREKTDIPADYAKTTRIFTSSDISRLKGGMKEVTRKPMTGTHLVVLHGEGTAGAGTDAGLALNAVVSLGGVEVGLAVNEGKKAVGAGVDAGAAASAVIRSLRISRHCWCS